MLYTFRNLFICLGWVDSEVEMNKAMKKKYIRRRLNITQNIFFCKFTEWKKMQVVLGEKSRTEPERSLYFFAAIICFNVTGKVGNQWQHLSGNRWSTAELFGAVCIGGMSWQGKGCSPAMQDRAPRSCSSLFQGSGPGREGIMQLFLAPLPILTPPRSIHK